MLCFDQEILGSPVEGVEVNISCQTEDLGNVTPTLRLTRLGLAAQTVAGVETLLYIAIVLDVLTTDLVGYHSTQNVTVSRIPGTGNYSFCLMVSESVSETNWNRKKVNRYLPRRLMEVPM